MRVLFDGWELAYQPNSPAAIHLLTLLAFLPAGIEALVAVPSDTIHPLPPGVGQYSMEVANRAAGRLRWEQRLLPGLADAVSADLIHSFDGAALLGRRRSVLSPASSGWLASLRSDGGERPSLSARLREAFAQGGISRLRAQFWPADLEGLILAGRSGPRRLTLPVVVHPMFTQDPPRTDKVDFTKLGLPETFILYHGSGNLQALQRLLRAWSWAAGPIGDSYPLVLVETYPGQGNAMAKIARDYQVEKSVRQMPVLTLPKLAALYRACQCLFYPEETTLWGSPVRMALACSKPVVGLETGWNDRLIGQAGFLVREGESEVKRDRDLGAALISVIVEEQLAESLSQVARERSLSYINTRFSESLGEAYRSVIGS